MIVNKQDFMSHKKKSRGGQSSEDTRSSGFACVFTPAFLACRPVATQMQGGSSTSSLVSRCQAGRRDDGQKAKRKAGRRSAYINKVQAFPEALNFCPASQNCHLTPHTCKRSIFLKRTSGHVPLPDGNLQASTAWSVSYLSHQ